MTIQEEFYNRIDDDNGYDNQKLGDDLIKIAEKHHKEQLSQCSVVNWLPFEKENHDKFKELCKKDKCLCLFDDGTECNYNDEHPMAIMTHFAELT